MNDAPGSKNFFEEIKIPGIEGIIVTTSPGRVYITLVVGAGANAENLRKQLKLDVLFALAQHMHKVISGELSSPRM